MSDNKFILQLKGQQTPKSVVEIKNDKLVAPFVNVPNSSDAVGSIIQDKDSSVVVAKGAENWQLDGGSLVPATNLSGNGSDYTGEYAVSGNMLWVNSTYTFSDTKIFTPNTKWVLQLCGKNLSAGNGNIIDFSFIVKIGSTNIMTKTVTVSEQANFFCKRFVLDFSESIQTAIKAEKNTSLIVQLLCADNTASATIYNGMTTLTALQRRVDSEAVASDSHTFEDLEVEIADIADDLADHTADKNNPHEVTKAQVGLGNCDNTSDLDKPISTATQTALDGKVSTDGSSTMTGVLKMRATSSFQCAIAPFWDGVGFYKLNSDDSVTLIASIETPDGFTPWATNTYNIGSTLKKWKNLYLAGKAYMSVINNGYDIAIPVTNSADTFALKSQVDDAANSGEQLYTTGVWYAKMYAATVVPTGAEYDGRNYADFSQVDSDNNPVIKIYTGASGAWTLTETITPPANHNGYMTITSKIWDIAEQAGQQGGKILWSWNNKTFTPYPQIISFENAALTGTPTTPTPSASSPSAMVANKDYVDTELVRTSGKSIDADIVGTLTIASNGDVSGFSLNDYLKLPADIDFSTSTFEIDCAFTATNISSAIFALGRHTVYGIQIWKNLNDDKIQAKINTQTLTGTTSLLANTKYFVKLVSDGVNYTLSLSTDGTNYVQEATAAISDTPKLDDYRLGRSSPDATLHMSNYRIKQNGIVVWNGLDAAGLHQRVAKGHEVIEFQAPTAANNYTWYRLYADGWVEQGGVLGTNVSSQTITLPIEMSDTYYQIMLSVGKYSGSGTGGYEVMSAWGKRTKTTFYVDSRSGSEITGNWQVSGMAAS